MPSAAAVQGAKWLGKAAWNNREAIYRYGKLAWDNQDEIKARGKQALDIAAPAVRSAMKSPVLAPAIGWRRGWLTM